MQNLMKKDMNLLMKKLKRINLYLNFTLKIKLKYF